MRVGLAANDKNFGIVSASSAVTPERMMWIAVTLVIFAADMFVNYRYGRDIGHQYVMKITPPAFFFLIWIAIYILIAILIGMLIFKENTSTRNWSYLNIVNILNMVWLLISFTQFRIKLYLSVLTLISMVFFCYMFWHSLVVKYLDYGAIRLFTSNTAAFYLGWCVCAATLNICQLLMYHFSFSTRSVLIFFCLTAAVLTLIFTKIAVFDRSDVLHFLGFYASVAWGIIGVAISSNKEALR